MKKRNLCDKKLLRKSVYKYIINLKNLKCILNEVFFMSNPVNLKKKKKKQSKKIVNV